MPVTSPRPFISVLLCAHLAGNRDYLKEAMESLALQTLARDKFEVLLVKDFTDPEIDGRAANLGFLRVLCPPGPLAGKILAGYKAGRGEVFTPLDYDDRFVPERLQVVYDAFSANPDLGYLHDGIECIDEYGHRISRGLSPVFRMMDFSRKCVTICDSEKERTSPRLGFSRPDFHGMSLRRPVVAYSLPYLSRIQSAVDTLFFNAGWTFPLSVQVEPRKLYQYRLHVNNTSLALSGASGDLLQLRRDWRRRMRQDYAVILEMIREGDRKELQRDFELRTFSDDVLSVIRDAQAGQKEIWKIGSVLPYHIHRTNLSPLMLYTTILLALGIVARPVARAVATMGE